MPLVDLRSDTVTKPTDEMYRAIRKARLGDDGWNDDPTVKELERLAARLLDKEAAILVPTGTMANLLALITHTGRGGEVLLERTSHIARSEMGNVASVAGLFHRGLPGIRGEMDLDELREAVAPVITPRRLATALICMETTHNAAGGAVLSLEHMRTVTTIAKEARIPIHLDGSRIFNAATALRKPAAEVAYYSDSVTVCLSKGLSAPIGSLLAGPEGFIARARPFRKMLGGTMRQAGLIAAAGIVALNEMVKRLHDDHTTAMTLAKGLSRIDPSLVDPNHVQTNIVMVDVSGTGRAADTWVSFLSKHRILTSAVKRNVIRFVTHRHISLANVQEVVRVFSDIHAAERI